VCSGSSRVARIGGPFDRTAELQERLQQAPGEEARQELAATETGPPPSRWTLRVIRATVPWLQGYTLSGVWRVLRRAKLKLRQGRLQQYSPDPDYVAKVDRILQCLREAVATPEDVVVVFLDEMGYHRWPDAAPTWAAQAPAPQPCTHPAGPNNQQWRIIGAVNALTGRLDYGEGYIVGRAKVMAFYRQVVAAYPDAERIYVVQDNWSIHAHPAVLAVVAELPQIEIVWLPTYAPWLNPIEKAWRWLRQDVLKLHCLAHDWPALRTRVNAFLDQFADGSHALLHYVGLLGEGKYARVINST
jgi:DDE superfamily endonuclease